MSKVLSVPTSRSTSTTRRNRQGPWNSAARRNIGATRRNRKLKRPALSNRRPPRQDHERSRLVIIESPRLALNEQKGLSAALYRHLVTQADASRGQVQFIIADNKLPPTIAATQPPAEDSQLKLHTVAENSGRLIPDIG